MKKNLSKILFVGGGLLVVLAACKKMTNTYYGNGSAPVLSSSVKTVAATPTDSLTNVIAFSWTNPKYATDSATEKYTIQIDSSGRGFTQPVSFVVSGSLWDSLTAKEINTTVLGLGGAFNTPMNVDVRLVSSYGNNNEQLTSNTVTIQVTPYKTPPKVVPPTGPLYLVGSASQGGWNAPVPTPSQVFEEVDSTDYAGVFNLTAAGQYLILPQNTGSYDNKIATNDATPAGTGGTFAYNANNNFNGPAAAGWYTIWLNFFTGTITVTPYSGVVPTNLYIVGDATPGGWNNPVPVPSQQLTQLNSSQFSVTLPIIGGKGYLFLPLNGDWTNKYAVGNTDAGATGGTFGYNLSNNFTGPTTSGTYTITADFLTWKYKVTQ